MDKLGFETCFHTLLDIYCFSCNLLTAITFLNGIIHTFHVSVSSDAAKVSDTHFPQCALVDVSLSLCTLQFAQCIETSEAAVGELLCLIYPKIRVAWQHQTIQTTNCFQ